MSLMLPQNDPYGDGLQLTAAARFDAVVMAVANCWTPDNVARVEAFLHGALERARRREAPADWIRDGLALCAARRSELITEGGETARGVSAHPDRS
jgi:hypothetical protein